MWENGAPIRRGGDIENSTNQTCEKKFIKEPREEQKKNSA